MRAVSGPDSDTVIRVALLREGARLPARATVGSTGLDVFACLGGDGDTLRVGADPVRVPTGIAMEFPASLDVQVRPRSGLTSRGVTVPVGTIDSDYRGEIFVTMHTVGALTQHTVRHGDRIAQIVVLARAPVSLQVVQSLTETDRGAGGHGSTGG